jgi:tRNA(fMet)-specific endonuclease VapC
VSRRYLLDTNICIYLAKHQPPQVRKRFQRHAASELAISVVTLGELRFGAEKSQARERALKVIEELEAVVEVVELPVLAGVHYGQIRAGLDRQGLPLGNNDLWLAAHARALGWVLITNNEREFKRVEGLHVENWAR